MFFCFAAALSGPLWPDYFTEAIARDLAEQSLAVQSIAVGPVSMIGGEQSDLCRLYAERLTTELKEKTRYVIVDRQNLDKLLEEIELSQSDLPSESAMLQVGKMLSAQALLSLVIAELAEGTEMLVRLTAVETAQVLYARSYKDFQTLPAAGSEDYRPEHELGDYSSPSASGTAGGAAGSAGEQVPALVLRPDSTQKRERLGRELREQAGTRLGLNNRLYQLSRSNPALYQALSEARKKLIIIARDRDLMILLVFHSPRLAQELKERHPVLTRRLQQRFQQLRRGEPRKEEFVLRFLKRYGELLRKDKLLIAASREYLEELARQAAQP